MLGPTTKDIISIAGSIIKDAAILCGAAASYYLFWYKRQIYPRAKLILSVEQHRMPRKKLLIRVEAIVQNAGEVLIQLDQGYANLCLIAPCDKRFNDEMHARVSPDEKTRHEVAAPHLVKLRYKSQDKCELEPGESESIFFDFIVERGKYRLLQVKVHFSNAAKRKTTVGWSEQRIIEVKCDAKEPSSNGVTDGRERPPEAS